MYCRRQKNILKRNKSVVQKETQKDSDELIVSEEDIGELTDDNGDGDDDEEDLNNEISNNNFLFFLTGNESKSTKIENDGASDSDKENELLANMSSKGQENTENREVSIASLCSAKAVKDSAVKGWSYNISVIHFYIITL